MGSRNTNIELFELLEEPRRSDTTTNGVITSKPNDVAMEGKEFEYREKPATKNVHNNFEILQKNSTLTANKTNAQDQHDFSNNYHNDMCSATINTEEMHVDDDATSKELDVVTGNKRGYTKQRGKRKMDSITLDTIQQYVENPIKEASRRFDGEKTYGPLYCSQLIKESDEVIEMMAPFSKHLQAHFGLSPKKKNVVNALDTRMVTVKATFKDDVIKFQFPLLSGVSELKNQVAQRLKLKTSRLSLKYIDEDDDLILISHDADFCNLVPFSTTSASKNIIKLIVQMADD